MRHRKTAGKRVDRFWSTSPMAPKRRITASIFIERPRMCLLAGASTRHHIENPSAGQFRDGGQGSSACPGLRCSRIGAREPLRSVGYAIWCSNVTSSDMLRITACAPAARNVAATRSQAASCSLGESASSSASMPDHECPAMPRHQAISSPL